MVEGMDQDKQVDEYVVIQRRIMKGKEEPWMVWGTTQETSVDEMLGKLESAVTKEELEAV